MHGHVALSSCVCLFRCQTERSLKVVIGPGLCGQPLASNLFALGYVSGSTRGFACQLAAYLLLQCKHCDPFMVPAVKQAVLSWSRLKMTIVTFDGPLDRATDSMRSKSRAASQEELHPIMIAASLLTAAQDLPTGTVHGLSCVLQVHGAWCGVHIKLVLGAFFPFRVILQWQHTILRF